MVEIHLKTGEILRVSGGWDERPKLDGYNSHYDTNFFKDAKGNVYIVSSTNISYVKIAKEA